MPRATTRRAKKGAPVLPSVADFRRHLITHADQLAPADITSLVGNTAQVRERLAAAKRELDGKFVERVKTAVALLTDHAAGRCPQVPYRTVALLAAALFYFLDPIDVIPDCIPGGTTDDALVLDLAWQLAHAGVERYLAARGCPGRLG